MTKALALGLALAALIWGVFMFAPGLKSAPGLMGSPGLRLAMHAGVAPRLGQGLSLVQEEDGHPEPCRSLAAIFALHGPAKILGAIQMHPPAGFTGPVLLVVVFRDRSSVLHPRDPAGCYLSEGLPYLTIDWMYSGA